MDKPKKFKLKIDKKALLLVDWANVYGWKKSLGWEVCPQRLYNFFDRPKVINKIFYYGEDEGQEKSENFMTEIKNIGFDISPKKVKWVPVLLENQSHFKKIVNNLFDILNIIKIRNSEISNNLYKLVSKIKKIERDNNTNNKEVEEIFESIEDIDYILDRLNIDIDDLEKNLKEKVSRRKCDFDVEITRDALNLINEYDILILFSGDGDYFSLVEDLIKKGKKVILVFAKGHKGKEYDEIKNSLFFACSVDKLRNVLERKS
jgi:uncharacterized LabA/DUF88 family protein